MACHHYRTDSRNRLIITAGSKNNARIFILGGAFGLDRRNRLTYTISRPAYWRRRIASSNTIVFDGSWGLDSGQKLVYTLHQTKNQYYGDRLHLNADLVQTDEHSLVFSVASRQEDGGYSVRLLKFQGEWQAQKDERLSFLIQTSGETQEKFTFSGRWQVRNNQLIYTCQRLASSGKRKEEHTLAFKGYWSLDDDRRLSYMLSAGTRLCAFEFVFGHYYIRTDRNQLQFRLGAGVTAGPGRKRVVTFTGEWRLAGRTAISFCAEGGLAGQPGLRFGLGRFLLKDKRVTAELQTTAGKPLGVSLEFEQQFLEQNARWLLKLSQESGRPTLSAGVKILW